MGVRRKITGVQLALAHRVGWMNVFGKVKCSISLIEISVLK
jgi:hypothetical protein